MPKEPHPIEDYLIWVNGNPYHPRDLDAWLRGDFDTWAKACVNLSRYISLVKQEYDDTHPEQIKRFNITIGLEPTCPDPDDPTHDMWVIFNEVQDEATTAYTDYIKHRAKFDEQDVWWRSQEIVLRNRLKETYDILKDARKKLSMVSKLSK